MSRTITISQAESRWGSPQERISHTNAESSFIYRSLKNDSQAAAIIQTLIKTRCPLHCDGVMLAITWIGYNVLGSPMRDE